MYILEKNSMSILLYFRINQMEYSLTEIFSTKQPLNYKQFLVFTKNLHGRQLEIPR